MRRTLHPETEEPKKIKVLDREMKQLNLHRHKTCPDWNYTIKPRANFGK